jgi:uncharacterized UBP type Zn finger protein
VRGTWRLLASASDVPACGYVGCCDKSKNKHAREHFRQTGHPLTRPYKERGMDWVWCYVNEVLLDPI